MEENLLKTQSQLLMILRTLTIIGTQDLREYVTVFQQQIDGADDPFMAMIDPTAYRNNHAELEDKRNQLAIFKAMLQAREAIDQREKYAARLRGAG